MNKTEYLKLLGKALIDRGMTKETAEYHMRVLSMSVSERDLVGRKDEEISKEITHLADSITLILRSESKDGESDPSPSSVVLPEYVSPDSVVPVDFDAENVPRGDELDELVGKSKMRRIRDEKPVAPTSGGIGGAKAKSGLFVLFLIFTWILRALCFILLIAFTVAGVALFALGLVYGISQLSTFKGAGQFEIGLSLIIGGVAVALGVMLYNCVGNFIPRCQQWIKQRIRNINSRIREARREKAKGGGAV